MVEKPKETLVMVSAESRYGAIAGKIAGSVRRNEFPLVVIAGGYDAIFNAVVGITTANVFLQREGKEGIIFNAEHRYSKKGTSLIKFTIENKNEILQNS
jgi:stage V sporulation protein SpoVS